MAIKVRALQDGFFRGSRVRTGTEFYLPEGIKPGKWMQVLEETPAVKKPVTPAAKSGKGKEDSELA